MFLSIENILLKIKNFINDNYIIILLMILIIILFTLIANINTKKKSRNYHFDKKKNDPLLINQNNIENKDEIEKKVFNLLYNLKIYKMNLDIDKIKNIVNNNIYDLYKAQIKTLSEKNQKNIIQDIKYINSYITNISQNNNLINLRMIIECYDYIICNNKVIKGSNNKKVLQTYEIEILNEKINKLELLYEREI